MKNLNLQDIVEILSEGEIIFKAEINYLGQDTNFECIEFTIDDKELYCFDYYLDIDTHGHTICGGKNNWFYSPKNKGEFMEFLKEGHIPCSYCKDTGWDSYPNHDTTMRPCPECQL